jgi:glycosyltransferase involved in cell wall biosynthesis
MNGPGIEEKQIQGVTTKASKKWVSNAHQKYILTNCDDLIIASKLIEIFVREKKGWKLPQNHVLLNGTIIPPPLKVNEIQIIRNQYQGKGNFLFIYSGSFYKWYGTLDMIKAISNVIEMKKNVRFILIGDGDAKNDILQYIKKKSLQQFIYVLPKMKHKDLMRYIQSVDFCLLYVRHKNSYAGSSTKLAEYMVCGKPVISTPQKKEMIDNGITGFLSESVDINDYTKAILFAMNNLEKAKQVAKNAKNKINKYYTWEKYCQNLIKIYNVSISTKKEKAWKKYFKIS